MEQLIALVTLILLEVVLGLDNIIFISIVAARLPLQQQKKARRMGILLAMVLRLALLTIISFILKLQGELFNVFDVSISTKDIILILGGLFLLLMIMGRGGRRGGGGGGGLIPGLILGQMLGGRSGYGGRYSGGGFGGYDSGDSFGGFGGGDSGGGGASSNW